MGVLFCLLLVFPASAARVVLKNGQVVEGLIVEDIPDDYIKLRTEGVELRFEYSQIASLDRGATEAVEEQLGDQMAKQGKHNEALKHYRAAQESGQGSAEIGKKIQRMERLIEEQELEQYSDQIQAAQTLIDRGRLNEAQALLRELQDTVKLESVKKRATLMLARVHYQRAQQAMDVVDSTTAQRELRIAIEMDPDFAAAHVELGDLYNSRQLGKKDALQEYLKALELGGDELNESEKNRIRWNVARIAHEMENWKLALEYYKKVYDSDRRYDPRLIDSMAAAFLRRANEVAEETPEEAIGLLREGIQYQPGDTAIRYRLIQLLIEEKRCPEALEELEMLFNIDYQYPNAHYLAAECLKRAKDVLGARDELQAEIRVNPEHIDALVELGDLSYDGGAFNDAERYYLQALENDPARISALLGLAKVYRRKENRVAARHYVEIVLDGHPENRAANLEMGTILKEEKNYTEARKFFDKVINGLQKQEAELTDDEIQLLADALNRRGEIYLLQDQPRTARNDFEEALKYEPDYGLTYYNIGRSYYKESTDEASLLKAETNLKKARELDPKNPQFAQGLGIFYHQYMSQREIPDPQKKEYLRFAVENYNDYLKLGGTDVDNVKKWIEECGGTVEES